MSNKEKCTDRNAAFDRAEALFKAAFSGIREPRSREYKQGVMAVLMNRCAQVEPVCPYSPGSVESDAWYAGTEEGHSVWRAHQVELNTRVQDKEL